MVDPAVAKLAPCPSKVISWGQLQNRVNITINQSIDFIMSNDIDLDGCYVTDEVNEKSTIWKPSGRSPEETLTIRCLYGFKCSRDTSGVRIWVPEIVNCRVLLQYPSRGLTVTIVILLLLHIPLLLKWTLKLKMLGIFLK